MSNHKAIFEPLFREINQGWLVVKYVECAVLFSYAGISNSSLTRWLMFIGILNIPHNILGLSAIYVGFLYPTFDPLWLWLLQASLAAIIRIVEFYVNYLIVSEMIPQESKYQKPIFYALNVIGAIGVLFGRLYDVLGSLFTLQSTVRIGMAIVSIFSLLPSLMGLYILQNGLWGKARKTTGKQQSKAVKLVRNSKIRLIMIQLIDVMLIINFTVTRTSIYSYWLCTIFDNLDNCRGLLFAVDLILTKLSLTECTGNSIKIQDVVKDSGATCANCAKQTKQSAVKVFG
ncbi:hypothetical protein BC833DRAFT_595535 [Globomyces pollinis-pini]|nr:hypothetical protein BC833DRAFT_595535 [Globomyces pollinis-pini]